MTRRLGFTLLFCAAALLGCGKSTPPGPPPVPVPPPTPAPPPPKPVPPPAPGPHRDLTFYHFGIGIADAAAHPVDYPSMGVQVILVAGNEFWVSPAAQSGLDDLCSRARAAVPSGPVYLSIRSYSQNGADDDLWQTDAARWSALVQRAKWLSAACATHDVSGVFIDWEWDAWGSYAGKPVRRYPDNIGWSTQAWQSYTGIDMGGRGKEFAAALRSAKPDLLLGGYGPYAMCTMTYPHKGGAKAPPGWLPFFAAYYGTAAGRLLIWEDLMVGSVYATSTAGYVERDFPGLPQAGGVNFSWLAAAGAVPVGAWSGAKYLAKFVSPACKAPSSGAAFFTPYPNWSKGLDDPANRAAIKRNLAALQ